MTTLHSLCDFCKFGSNCTCTATIVAVQPTLRYTPSGEHYDLCSQYRIDTACCVDLDASRTVSRPIVVQRLGLTIVDLRGVPLAVSTLWAGDSLRNRLTRAVTSHRCHSHKLSTEIRNAGLPLSLGSVHLGARAAFTVSKRPNWPFSGYLCRNCMTRLVINTLSLFYALCLAVSTKFPYTLRFSWYGRGSAPPRGKGALPFTPLMGYGIMETVPDQREKRPKRYLLSR